MWSTFLAVGATPEAVGSVLICTWLVETSESMAFETEANPGHIPAIHDVFRQGGCSRAARSGIPRAYLLDLISVGLGVVKEAAVEVSPVLLREPATHFHLPPVAIVGLGWWCRQ